MKTIDEVFEGLKENSVSLEEICAIYDGVSRCQQKDLEDYCDRVFMIDLFWKML